MVGSSMCFFGSFLEAEQRCDKLFPKQIDFCKTFIGFLVLLFPVTVRRLSPRSFSFPRSLIRLPKKKIRREKITFLSCKSGQPGAHIADHIVTFPSPLNDGVSAGNQRGKRFAFQIGFSSRKVRNAVIFKGTLQQRSIIVKPSDGYGDISPPAPRLSHYLEHFRRCQLAFGRNIFCPEKLNLSIGRKGFSCIGKDMFSEEKKWIVRSAVFLKMAILDRHTKFFCSRFKLSGTVL